MTAEAADILPAVFSRLFQVNRFAPEALISSPVKAADGVPDPAIIVVAGRHGIGVDEGVRTHFSQVNKAPLGIGAVETVTTQVRYVDCRPGKVEGNGTAPARFLRAQG